MEKDRQEEALAVLYKLHDTKDGTNKEFVELEYREIRDVINADRAQNQIS
jgi:hypothetical protein